MPQPPVPKNKAPSSITLSNSSINENAPGANIGVLTVKDPDKGDTAALTVSDSRFDVVTDLQGRSVLRLKSGVSLDYEAESKISIQVTATDSGGLHKTQSFTIGVSNLNEAPTHVALSNAGVAENAAGAVIGTLSASDPENNPLSFSVVGTEASRFEAVQDPTGSWTLALKAGMALDYEQQHSVDVTVRVSDGSLIYDEVLTLAVGDDPEGRWLISVASDGTQGNGGSYREGLPASTSADGRYVTYFSAATNLVAEDNNGGLYDVFVYDRQTGTTERVSVASDGTQGNSDSWYPSISADGRYIAYYSYASNLAPGDTNEQADIFIWDRETGTTERISLATDGTEANSYSLIPSISADGGYITYSSLASNLVAGDTNGSMMFSSLTSRLALPSACQWQMMAARAIQIAIVDRYRRMGAISVM